MSVYEDKPSPDKQMDNPMEKLLDQIKIQLQLTTAQSRKTLENIVFKVRKWFSSVVKSARVPQE